MMKEDGQKFNLPIITSEAYNLEPSRYELRKGNTPDAPLCPFGNHFTWIVFDTKAIRYVRATKSVFKKLLMLMDKEEEEEEEEEEEGFNKANLNE